MFRIRPKKNRHSLSEIVEDAQELAQNSWEEFSVLICFSKGQLQNLRILLDGWTRLLVSMWSRTNSSDRSGIRVAGGIEVTSRGPNPSFKSALTALGN